MTVEAELETSRDLEALDIYTLSRRREANMLSRFCANDGDLYMHDLDIEINGL